MDRTPTETPTDPATSLVVFWTMLLMLLVLVAGIVEVGAAFLSVDSFLG